MNVAVSEAVQYQRQSSLPALTGTHSTSILLYGAIFQNKVRASPAIRGVSERKLAVTRGNTQPAMENGFQRHGLPHQSGIKDRLKSARSTPTEGRRII